VIRSTPAGLLAVLPRGEAIRNFVYSGALERVAERTRVGVLSVLPNPRIGNWLRERFPEVRELVDRPEARPVRLVRELLDMAHGRWLWSEAAQERWRRRDQEAKTARLRAKRITKKLACLPFANRPGLRLLSHVERGMSRMLRNTESYLEFFRRLRPALVFNASHVHSRIATQALQAAQWLSIPTATFLFSWDNLTSQGRIMLPYDAYLVWNEEIAAQLLEIYPSIRPECVHVTGTPQFDAHFQERNYLSREEFCSRVGADPARPIALYTTGMANHMPGEPMIVEELAGMLAEIDPSVQLLVRVYPKDRCGRFDALRNRRPDILFQKVPWDSAWLTPLPEDTPLWTNTLRHACLGVNVASTVSLELCMFDKPVINVAYNPRAVPEERLRYARYYEFDHYRPVVESGAVAVARDRAGMRAMLRDALAVPGRRSRKRRALVDKMFGGRLDGRCGARVASTLLDLIEGGAR